METGTELCQQLCECVCVLVHGVSRLRSSGLHQGQMCNFVRSAFVPSSLSLILLQAPPSIPFFPVPQGTGVGDPSVSLKCKFDLLNVEE